MPTLGNFLHTQLVLKIPKPTASFASKTVIITGASSGLGKESAKHIVRLGASKVILGCRNITKGNETKRAIESALRCSKDILEVWELDIESPESIKKFVDRANSLPRLDVVINNAGIRAMNFKVVYETEQTIAVNVIGTFLLALQLIPKLKETAKVYGVTPHLTFVSSALYDIAKYPEHGTTDIFSWYADKSHTGEMKGMNQYNVSKLFQLYATIKLASIVDPAAGSSKSKSPDPANPIVINSLDPCFCKTGLGGEMIGLLGFAHTVFSFMFARPAEEGARLIVQTAAAGRQTHGAYMRAGAVQEYAPFITDEEGVEKSEYIWKTLCARLEQLQPGIMANLNTV